MTGAPLKRADLAGFSTTSGEPTLGGRLAVLDARQRRAGIGSRTPKGGFVVCSPPPHTICPACGNPWSTHSMSDVGVLWSKTSQESFGLHGCPVVDLLLGGEPGWAYDRHFGPLRAKGRRLPRVTIRTTRFRQRKWARSVEARCSECGEGGSTPEGWGGKSTRQIRGELADWAKEHRLEHLPGRRKGPPLTPPVQTRANEFLF